MAGSSRHYCGLAVVLQWPVARDAAAASQRCCNGRKQAGARNTNNAVEPWPTLRCNIFVFTQQFQRENESKTERKEAGFETCFPALFVGKPLPGSVCWQAPSRLCLLASSFLATSTPFNGRSNTSTFQQQQHQQHPQH